MNDPLSWPKSSLSRRFSGIAAQLTAKKVFPARAERAWMARATSSLPVPDSPRIRTVEFVGAIFSTRRKTSRIGGAVADDRLEAVPLQAPLEAERLLGEPEGLDGPLDAEEKLVGDDRLRHVVERAELVRLARPLDRAVRRDEDDLRRERPVLERLDDVDSRRAPASSGRSGRPRAASSAAFVQRLAAVGGDGDGVPLVREDRLQRLALVLFVVDDEEGGVRARCDASAAAQAAVGRGR